MFRKSSNPIDHTWSNNVSWQSASGVSYPVGRYYCYYVCSVCNERSTAQGGQYLDGTTIDWTNVYPDDLPIKVYYNGILWTELHTFATTDKNIKVEKTHSLDLENELLTVDAVFDYSDSVYRDYINETCNNYGSSQLVMVVQFQNNPNNKIHKLSFDSVDTSNCTATGHAELPIRDPELDYSSKVSWRVAFQSPITLDSGVYGNVGTEEAFDTFSTNRVEPSINSISCN